MVVKLWPLGLSKRAARSSGGSRICHGGGMASERSASLNGGLGAEPPAGSRGRANGGGQRGEAPLKLRAFRTFLYKQVAKS